MNMEPTIRRLEQTGVNIRQSGAHLEMKAYLVHLFEEMRMTTEFLAGDGIDLDRLAGELNYAMARTTDVTIDGRRYEAPMGVVMRLQQYEKALHEVQQIVDDIRRQLE